MITWASLKIGEYKTINDEVVSTERRSGYCLSTDTKPTGGRMANGSCLFEMDTGKIFLYDAEGAQWREF